MDDSNKTLIAGIKDGNHRALGRMITLCENQVPRSRQALKALYGLGGQAHIVGVTGAPGAGKSTLVDRLAAQLISDGKRVAILAIDPSSPFSGGAVLGDRIRMFEALKSGSVFMRSMATRGALGGISNGTIDAVQILDAGGFDYIFIETVGVGQAEVDISRTADTCLVVLVPGMGDGVQIMKAGILEIADQFVINKSDRDGVELLEKELTTLMSLVMQEEGSWEPNVLRAIAIDDVGTNEVVDGIKAHAVWLDSSPLGKRKQSFILRERIARIVMASLHVEVIQSRAEKLNLLVEKCVSRELDPHSAAQALIDDQDLS